MPLGIPRFKIMKLYQTKIGVVKTVAIKAMAAAEVVVAGAEASM